MHGGRGPRASPDPVIPMEALRQARGTPERLLHPLRRAAALRRLRRRPPPGIVLFVCHGNVCRSPYAAALLRRLLPSFLPGAVRVESAGFVGPGRPCPRWAVEVAAERGLDLSRHQSRLLTPLEVQSAELVVVMDSMQRRLLRMLFGGDGVVLGDLDPARIERREIEDPVEQAKEAFERSYSRIDRCVRALVEAVAAGAARRTSTLGVESVSHVEIGT